MNSIGTGLKQVLDIKRNYNKKLTSEMLHIKTQKRNLQIDTKFLDHAYISVLNTIEYY